MEQEVVTVGLDLAKNVFQVHAIGGDGAVLVRRKLRRAEVVGFFAKLPVCLVEMEACASAHHRARELIAFGHEVRLMPPAYVKPYAKRGKTIAQLRWCRGRPRHHVKACAKLPKLRRPDPTISPNRNRQGAFSMLLVKIVSYEADLASLGVASAVSRRLLRFEAGGRARRGAQTDYAVVSAQII